MNYSIRNLVIAALFTTLIIAPWTIRNYAVLGGFVPVKSQFGFTLWVGNNPYATGTTFVDPKYAPLFGPAPAWISLTFWCRST